MYLSGGYGCLPAGSLIDTIDGKIPIEKIEKSTLVKSFDDGKIVWSIASPSKSMGVKKCYKIYHEFGSMIVSEDHRILTYLYKYQLASQALNLQVPYFGSYLDNPLLTNSESSHLESLEDVLYWMKKHEDLMDRYSSCLHRYDQQLQKVKGICLKLAPLLNDVLRSSYIFDSYVFEHMDDLSELTQEYNHLCLSVLQSYKNHFFYQMANIEEVLEDRNASLQPERISLKDLTLLQFLLKMYSHHKMVELNLNSLSIFHENSCLTNTITTIHKIEEIESREVFDIHVLKTNNYIHNGIVHHNCGKTHSLVMKMFYLMDENKKLPGGFLVPNLKMFKKDVLPTIREICEKNNIEYDYNKTDAIFHFPLTDSIIYVYHAEDEGRSIRGSNLAFMLINEVTLIDKHSFDAALARVRIKDAKLLQVAMSGTPESFNWVYDYFIQKPRDDTDLIFGNSRENIYLADDYIKNLEASYDEMMIKQFIDGHFVNLTGRRAAWSFDRYKHLKPVQYQKEFKTWVSIDFNVDNMSAVFWNRHPIDEVLISAFHDVKIKSSNTYELAEYIKQKVGTDIVIYPDPAGNSRSSKSTVTDIQILKQYGFNDIRFKRSIPSVRACLNAMNNLLDKNKIIIDPSCTHLISDLEQVTLKESGLDLDKSNNDRTHWLDGMKNMIDLEFPIIERKQTQIMNM